MKRKGFTLIELLVVIGIIAMLVAIAIPNFLSARQRAGDARKKSEMEQLKTALRLYYNDFGTYPAGLAPTYTVIRGCGTSGTNNCDGTVCTTVDFAAGGTTGCDTVYMKKFPADFTSKYKYYQSTGGDDFCIKTTLDNTSDPDIVSSKARCATACTIGATNNCNTSTSYCACAD